MVRGRRPVLGGRDPSRGRPGFPALHRLPPLWTGVLPVPVVRRRGRLLQQRLQRARTPRVGARRRPSLPADRGGSGSPRRAAAALVEAAQSAARKKHTYLKDKFFRLKARRGHKRAAMAVAHKLLIAAYQMLATSASSQGPRRNISGRTRQDPSHLESCPTSRTAGLRCQATREPLHRQRLRRRGPASMGPFSRQC